MNKILIIVSLLASSIFLGACSQQTPENVIVIEFKNGTYTPSEITIKQYQKVTFINQSDTDIWPASNIHPTHQIYPQFDPQKPVKPNQSWSFTFDRVGTLRFHDHLSPQITGIITTEQ